MVIYMTMFIAILNCLISNCYKYIINNNQTIFIDNKLVNNKMW